MTALELDLSWALMAFAGGLFALWNLYQSWLDYRAIEQLGGRSGLEVLLMHTRNEVQSHALILLVFGCNFAAGLTAIAADNVAALVLLILGAAFLAALTFVQTRQRHAVLKALRLRNATVREPPYREAYETAIRSPQDPLGNEQEVPIEHN